ncbi:bladder cancer-related bc10 [Emericellopsis cladophorae]|uniref:Bladder cancer-related bc10 n=1 Tax=Emericellopsis cladophorae TaxID=2686198 RepID=A0A9P9Y1F9_9HYPO|nr:bladder cancer-related bc10 [Emericellopsis cladophorae]KAI6781600.1 bladder cancer-related bc10 [Emericellopsis cladophorae]
MFCLRSWLPLLFIPTNASPAFILLFFIGTYFLNRPCVYCSLLLLILFCTSCVWSDQCLFDRDTSQWFHPRPGSSADMGASSPYLGHETILPAVVGGALRKMQAERAARWTGLGAEWLRNLLGKREWTVDCMGVNIQL